MKHLKDRDFFTAMFFFVLIVFLFAQAYVNVKLTNEVKNLQEDFKIWVEATDSFDEASTDAIAKMADIIEKNHPEDANAVW
jgi:hypothetical protein